MMNRRDERHRELVAMALYYALRDTRSELGIPIWRVAKEINNAFAKEEVESLITALRRYK